MQDPRSPLHRRAGLLVALVGCLALGTACALRPGATPKIRAQPQATPIALLTQVTLGGAAQSVLVRGADRSRPIVLMLHGGPGMPTMYLAHDFQRVMEQRFVMVHWDRRGAGRSWPAREPKESLTVRRTLDDLYELRAWLENLLGSAPRDFGRALVGIVSWLPRRARAPRSLWGIRRHGSPGS
jgi:pimeloyl-ACP methyl ester carboxylesterase